MEGESITNEPELIKNFLLGLFKSLFDSLKMSIQSKKNKGFYTLKLVVKIFLGALN